MHNPRYSILLRVKLLLLVATLPTAATANETARDIIRSALNHFRDVSSYSVAQMVIHRPNWERSMEMQAWTEGLDRSLVRITAPKKDVGNATLLIDDEMWSYSPKINRSVKVPSSMSNQSWMGSDFSNNDIARADDLLNQYEHRVLETQIIDNQKIYVIESIPHDDAPVVWGKEIVKIRDDHVLLEHLFYNQDGVLKKKLTTREIRFLSGRNIATVERMQKIDTPDEWTEFRLSEIKFGIVIPANTFTLSNLSNPRF